MEQARTYWNRDKVKYERLSKHVYAQLNKLISSKGISATITCRLKSTDSLLKKMMRKGSQYKDITDKVGLRVVVVFLDELVQIRDGIRAQFSILKEEDKAATLEYDRFNYSGIHFDAEDPSFPGHVFEIQLRTLHQDVWAEVSHRLIYKQEEHMSILLKRRIHALSALLEVGDMNCNSILKSINKLPQTETISVLNRLEYYFLQLIGIKYDRELSYEIVDSLKTLLPAESIQFIDTFVENHRQRLFDLYQEYNRARDSRHVLLFQPESILIFALLTIEKYKLQYVWAECGYPPKWLEGMALAWGQPF